VREGICRGHRVAVVVGWEVLEILRRGFVLSLAFELEKGA
jgi:hypothetical protein